MHEFRFILACLLAPLTPVALLIAVPNLLLAPEARRHDQLWIAAVGVPVAYLAFAISGLPLVFFLKKRERLSIISLGLLSIAVGFVMWCVFLISLGALFQSPTIMWPSLHDLVFGSVFGVGVSVVFGWIAGIPLHRSR